MPTLAKRSKWFQTEKPININDLVLIMDINMLRNEWIIGKVIAVYPGMDGEN